MTLTTSNQLADSLFGSGKTEQAIRVAKRALEDSRTAFGENSDVTQESMFILGRVHSHREEWDEADKLLVRVLELRRRNNTPDDPQRLHATEELGSHYLRKNECDVAASLFREAFDVRVKVNPNDWATFNSMTLLGTALLDQKKYSEAEPILLRGYEGMKACEKTIPNAGKTRIPETLDRLINYYTTTNMPDEVRKWQSERAKYGREILPAPAVKK